MKAALLAIVLAVAGAPAAAETVAIVGATVWTGASERPLERATVVIRDGRIVSVGDAPPPSGARILPGQGRVVTPPLDAAVTQIGLVDAPASSDVDDRALTAEAPLNAAFDAARGFDPNAQTVQEARAQGVGAALIHPSAHGGSPFAGRAARVRLHAETAAVERAGAAVVVHAGSAGAGAAGGSRGAVWTVLRAALDAAPAVAASADRPSPGGRPLLGPADAAALLPVLRREAPLAVVADREADIRQALSLAKERNLRLVILGGAEAWRVARELAEARVPVVLDPLDDLPTSPETIGARPENAALLAAAGVEIGFAVSGQGVYLSYLPGVGLRQGAGVAVANGLPYARALAAITSAPKRIWGGDADAGVIAPGRPADLVLWDGDPLEPVSGPLAIFADGRQVSPVTRQTLLRDRYRPARAQAPR